MTGHSRRKLWRGLEGKYDPVSFKKCLLRRGSFFVRGSPFERSTEWYDSMGAVGVDERCDAFGRHSTAITPFGYFPLRALMDPSLKS